jgi:Asp-tRNA(Asn)/Glu-tRNA(Gln) amidotransferase A subunit family amidase
MTDMLLQPATLLATKIRNGELSSVDLAEATFARIDEVNPALNAFTAIYREEALRRAKALDAAQKRGETLGELHGLPVAIKDMTPIRGKVNPRGSRAFAAHIADADAAIVERLVAAGAIIAGKTTTPEFAYSSFTGSPLWGTTRNPHDPQRTSGGSSGGSAVAVATGCAALAEGSDMGGSIRIPASFCGVVGLKPSLGRIPMDILPTVFDSISHIGPIARTVDDAALFLKATQGPDDRDIQSLPCRADIETPVPRDVGALRIAVSPDLGYYAVEPPVLSALSDAARSLSVAGARVEPVDLKWSRAINDAWMRYWEVFLATHFGEVLEAHRADMDPNVVALIERGRLTSAVEFKRIEELRTRLWRDLAEVFHGFDALLCPTMTRVAPLVEMRDADFDATLVDGRYDGLDMTCPFNFVGQCPALTVPAGSDAKGLPIGVQIVGQRFCDDVVLRIGAALMQSHV